MMDRQIVIERRLTIPYHAVSTFVAEPTAPALARAWSLAQLRGVLSDAMDEDLADDTALVVSELVTNAIQAGASSASLELIIDAGRLRIAVSDDVPGHVEARDATPEDVHGRGLAIVAALAQDWGVRMSMDGKIVWAELSATRSRSAFPADTPGAGN
jgi:anti-sigma regulatory factor (Ser/Thr protein kinase)